MRTAVVTGAARGIGFAVAEKLFHAGHRVVMVDVLDLVHDSAGQLNDTSRVSAIQADIRNPDEVRKLFEAVVQKYDTVDIIVNVAGTCHRDSFEEMTLEHWRQDVETNMTGTFLMCQAATFPYMKRQQYGRIINIASVSGKAGGLDLLHSDIGGGRSGVAYAASKAGVINMTRWMAKEVGKWGITCNSVAPGPIATKLTEGYAYNVGEVPMRRWGTPEDVAEAVEFLARESSSYITGECMHVDGGIVMA
ncbi:SDR family oxidoreductase [Alicyclobacillus fastidiosus]|uniref:SDR family oxidoreductase n=1 Tax=Alicyclobacillus fastidiosus TaxID=392011 RepID=A0ABY6ZEY9_9BACL|nr:SDR family NAD(P)-dependent oxidoreductase [Alicyclobacillus fastidiosus]WAH41290.1 SDR family oxidoreductase [Alicyclobacillus fastidiosus]GMA62888.1 beta-ketoacyl-ACP reductase [Alicyclobacillus fastidiosus]